MAYIANQVELVENTNTISYALPEFSDGRRKVFRAAGADGHDRLIADIVIR